MENRESTGKPEMCSFCGELPQFFLLKEITLLWELHPPPQINVWYTYIPNNWNATWCSCKDDRHRQQHFFFRLNTFWGITIYKKTPKTNWSIVWTNRSFHEFLQLIFELVILCVCSDDSPFSFNLWKCGSNM